MWLVHRLVYFLLTGERPEIVMHRCANPACIEPSHLRGGTQIENVADRDAKGRRKGIRNGFGEKHHSAKLTEQDVRDIREDPTPTARSRSDTGSISRSSGRSSSARSGNT